MKPGRAAVILHALLDLFLASLTSAVTYRFIHPEPDSSLYGAVLAFAVATFTISAFVCTMNYTGSNRLLEELIQENGHIFRDRWVSIFALEILGSALPIILMMLPSTQSTLAGSLAMGALALSMLQAVRSLRLLLALMRVAEISNKRDAREEAERASVEERDASLMAVIERRRREAVRK